MGASGRWLFLPASSPWLPTPHGRGLVCYIPWMLGRYRSLSLIVWLSLTGGTLACQEKCPAAADGLVAVAWDHYRAGDIPSAEEAFAAAAGRCPSHQGARVGLGYAAMRLERPTEADSLFRAVLADNPDVIDALVGLGLLAWRSGDLAGVHRNFSRVEALDPGNETANRYLSLLPTGTGPPPERPPLVRPDTAVYPARVRGERFEVRTASGWQSFYLKGVNLGAALPGKHPSQFPDSTTYAGWLADMAGMGANTVRLYTIHPPSFYQALRTYNLRHPDSPLWLVHGVWAELPPGHDYQNAEWEADFFAEMRHVVDLLHGRADILPRPGHASGFYVADVSRWTLGYIIGREWEPMSVVDYNAMHPDGSAWAGRFLTLQGGTATDAWMAKACDYLIGYEMDTYGAQRPIAYTNWPTLDPLDHPSETTVAEEIAIRAALGETVGRPPLEYDNDAEALDATLVRATDAFPAGYFASYHVYPYYPDFMILDATYQASRSSEGPSNFFGYLRDLQRHHAGMPVVISEYGVPTSIGIAHLQPQGWHHGGLTEAEMAEADARLTREIAEAGMAGGILFAWIDEWFKKNWMVIDFEIPLERNRLWFNRLDAEQHYGMIALEPIAAVSGLTLADRETAWSAVPTLYRDGDGRTLKAAADEAYLWLHLDWRDSLPPELLVGLDMVNPDAGQTRWQGPSGHGIPIGIEFVLHMQDGRLRLLADGASNVFRIQHVRPDARDAPVVVAPAEDLRPPGFFSGRFEQHYNDPYITRQRDDGRYDSLLVVTNRPRFARDGTEYAAMGYDRGLLPRGEAPDGLWSVDLAAGVLEVRIPWNLLNVTDPSERRVLQDQPGTRFGTVTVPDIGIVVAVPDDRDWRSWPASGAATDAARFTWPTWETPRWRARKRPVFDVMRGTFEGLGASTKDAGP